MKFSICVLGLFLSGYLKAQSGLKMANHLNNTDSSVVQKLLPQNPCNDTGTVVVAIKVNRAGKVKSAEVWSVGTTTQSDCLLKKARSKALRYTFEEDRKGTAAKKGTIKFIFKE